MLSGMRAFVRSKWALGLFALLIVSFGIFGFNDPFSGVAGGGFVRAGDRSVSPRDANRILDRELEARRQESGEVMTQRQAAEQGLTQAVVNELTTRTTLLAYADKIGVRASPKAVAEIINGAAIFKDGLGGVDKEAIARYAAEQRMTVAQFEAELRDSLSYDYLSNAAIAGLSPPRVLTQPIIAYLGERRTISVARLTRESIPAIAAPGEAQLRAFYQERAAMFAQPERRSLSAIAYTVDDYIDRVEVAEEAIAAEYQARIREFSAPETRTAAQFVSADRAAVQAVVDSVKQGKALEQAVAASPGVTLSTTTVKPDDVQNQNLRETIFALPQGEIWGPVDVDGQYYGVQVRTIIPGEARPLETVADELRSQIARRDAQKLFDDSAEPFYDMVGGGLSLEEMSAEIGAPLIRFIAVDQQAAPETRAPSALLSRHPDALAEAFRLKAGETTAVVEADGERLVLRLDAIVAPRTPAFEEVRPDLTPIYMAMKEMEAADKAANDVAAAIRSGRAFKAAAEAARMVVIDLPAPVTRAQPGALDQAVAAAAFAIAEGETSVARSAQQEPWVIRVEKVEPYDPAAEGQLALQVDQVIRQSLAQDLSQAFLRAVQSDVSVRRNEKAISDYLASFTSAEE